MMWRKKWFGPHWPDPLLDAMPDRGKMVLPGSQEGLEFGYDAKRFNPERNFLFIDGNIIYISFIELCREDQNKGIIRGLFSNLFKDGYTIAVPNPLGIMVDICWKYGFSLRYEGEIEIWELDSATHSLPKIRAGFTGYKGEDFIITAFSEFLDSKGLAYRIVEMKLKNITDDWRDRTLDTLKKYIADRYEKSELFRMHYPNKYHVVLMPQNERIGDTLLAYIKSIEKGL